jgi:hypothetical protein
MSGRTPRQFDGIDDDDDVVDLGEHDPDEYGIGDDDVESEEPDDEEADLEAMTLFGV